MADCRFPSRDTVCVETNRILDCCRDRDCFENTRVYLTGFGNDIISHTGAVRVRDAELLWTSIGIDPIQFNRGFYSVSSRHYVRIVCEACIGGGHSQDFDGLAILDKNVVLYGGESGAKVFRSNPKNSGFCAIPEPEINPGNLPEAVVEAVDPVVLGVSVNDACNCPLCGAPVVGGDIPPAVLSNMSAELRLEPHDRILTVTLGLFSVIRLMRPGEFLVNAQEYSVPDKECTEPIESNPCNAFRKMAFPISEFTPTPLGNVPPSSGCGQTSGKSCGSSS